jgi:GR25 family glycosyltransferase involved in LPS biosynthesis
MFYDNGKQLLYLFLLVVIFYILILLMYHFPENYEKTVVTPKNTTAYVINLDKNTDRLETFKKSYELSDISEISLIRFPAIVGKNVNMEQWLPPETMKELEYVEKKGYRTHHYQLTRGGVGCFIIHYTLAKKLLSDKRNDYYLIMEDDIIMNNVGFKEMQEALLNAPENWDILLFGFLRIINPEYVGNFIRPSGYWGMHGYLLNRKGAKKLVLETELIKMDGQIDAFISRMIQQNKMNVYAYKKHIFYPVGQTSNIQTGLRIKEGVDPYNYKGYIV